MQFKRLKEREEKYMKFNLDNFIVANRFNEFELYIIYDEKQLRVVKSLNSCLYWNYRVEHWCIRKSIMMLHIIPPNKKRIKENGKWINHLYHREIFDTIVRNENMIWKAQSFKDLQIALNSIKKFVIDKDKMFSNIINENGGDE